MARISQQWPAVALPTLVAGGLLLLLLLAFNGSASAGPMPQQGYFTPEPTPTPVPTVIVPEAEVTPVPAPEGGATAIIQPNQEATIESPGQEVIVEVPPLATAKTSQLEYKPRRVEEAPPPVAGTQTLRAFELNLYDSDGNLLTDVELIRPITIRVRFTQADLDSVGGDFTRLRVVVYRATTGAWVPLATSVDLANRELIAQVRHLTLFGVRAEAPPVAVTPTPTPTGVPPIVGGTAPGAGLLIGVVILGLVLLVTGGYIVARARRGRA